MSSRKVVLKVEMSLTLDIDDNMELDEVMDELDYDFTPESGASVVDSELRDYEVIDSK